MIISITARLPSLPILFFFCFGLLFFFLLFFVIIFVIMPTFLALLCGRPFIFFFSSFLSYISLKPFPLTSASVYLIVATELSSLFPWLESSPSPLWSTPSTLQPLVTVQEEIDLVLYNIIFLGPIHVLFESLNGIKTSVSCSQDILISKLGCRRH